MLSRGAYERLAAPELRARMQHGSGTGNMPVMTRDATRPTKRTVPEGSPPGGAERPPHGAEPADDTQRRGRLANLVSGPEPIVRAAEALDGAVDAAVDVATRLVPASQPVARAASAVEGAVGAAVGAASRRWDERPGARVRRVRRLARETLPYLYDVHPEARRATPHDLGVRTIDVEEIVGTAVGPPGQRGADFLPLRPFRSKNWAARWQRIRGAIDRLAVLPPIDAVFYGDGYWVLDGHNRVAAALYSGQIGVDANVTELVAPGATSTQRAGSLASTVIDGRAVRTAGAGHRTGNELGDDDPRLPIRDEPP
jgi:hypothetical protein